MNHTAVHKKLARGEVRWMAPRMKPVVKKHSLQKSLKPKKHE